MTTTAVPGTAVPGLLVPGQPWPPVAVQPLLDALPGLGAPGILAPGQPLPPTGPTGNLTARPGLAIPGLARPGMPLGAQSPAFAALIALPAVSVTAARKSDALWDAYLAAQQRSCAAWEQWHMMRQAGGTDGSAGFLFGQAYEAQAVTDSAYAAYLTAKRADFPGATG